MRKRKELLLRPTERTMIATTYFRRAFVFALLFGLTLVVSRQADAIIDINLQMQLGNPTGATADTNAPNHHLHWLIQHPQYALDYSDTNRQPNWVSWDLTSSDVGSSGRTDAWSVESNVPPDFHPVPTSTFGSVNGQSYDRGHMCPSADRTATVADNEMTFIMSNIIPQASENNQGLWATFEGYSRSLLSSLELLIISGPASFGPYRIASGGHAAIASNVWKIVVCVPLGAGTALSRITNADPASIRVIAINTPNDSSASGKSWQNFITSVKQVQDSTGYSFFTALPSNLAWVLRSKVDGQPPAAPGSIAFSPQSGPVATSITITGPNLDSTTNVTFNGASASYTITATNQLTATVPLAATSGPITVRTLGGAATSAGSFVVTGSTFVDLAVRVTHAGDFTQGGTGATYTITVTNLGTLSSSGTVTVADTLSAGLTATAIGGAGWTADLATLTATRSDALAAGTGYPPIIVTVNVASNAPASVTNIATVSNDTDVGPANNTASHLTTINVLPFTDLTANVAHSGNFIQGATGAAYIITVTNLGTLASSGTVTLNNALPAGLTATAIGGAGWTADLATLSASRSETLAAGASFPPITITVNVASNAPTAVTTTVALSGGADGILANNTNSHPTAISPGGGGGSTGTLVGWDTSGSSNFGPSPFSPTTNATDVTSVGLTRGAGVGTSGTGASRAWGGNNFTSASAAGAIAAGQYVTFSVAANPGYKVSCSSISRFDYRRSSSGPTNGLVQYQIGSGSFNDISTVPYSSSSSSGVSLPPINLSGILALQNVGPGTNITFRIVNWGATTAGGTWYIFDVGSSSAPDFLLEGTVAPVNTLPVISPFPITAAGFVGPGQFAITWNSVSGRNYQVQSVTSLSALNWTTNATVTATSAVTSWTNPVASDAAGFYRVVATP